MSTDKEEFSFRKRILLKNVDPKVYLSPRRNTCNINLALHFPILLKEKHLDTLQAQWQDVVHIKETVHSFTHQDTYTFNFRLG